MHRWLAVPILLVALPLTGAENLVRNPSFEQFDEAGRALVWQWHAGRAVGEHAFDTQLARTGRASLRITNPTPRAPHVFCHLEQTIAVSPNRQYTLSAYARGGHAGGAWIGGGEGWKVRRVLPAGSAWQRCEITFTSGPEERAWTLMILSEDGGPPLWIDDLQLEEGPRATAFELPQPLEPGAMELRVIAGEQGVNKLPNASFEKQVEGQSAGWRWDRRNTDATCTPDGPGHSGRVALRFTNGTAFGAHVYGSLSLAEPLPVAPNTTYTLSYWCRTTGRPGRAWVGGGTDWRVRLIVPHTNGEWQRVSTTFTTGDQDTSIPVLAVIESPSPPFWIDDVQLEPGAAMTAFEAPDTVLPAQLAIAPGAPLGTAPAAWKPELYPPGSWAFCDRELTLDGLFSQPAASTGTIEVRLKDGDAVLAAARHAGLPIRARLQARWGLPAETPEQKRRVERMHFSGRSRAASSLDKSKFRDRSNLLRAGLRVALQASHCGLQQYLERENSIDVRGEWHDRDDTGSAICGVVTDDDNRPTLADLASDGRIEHREPDVTTPKLFAGFGHRGSLLPSFPPSVLRDRLHRVFGAARAMSTLLARQYGGTPQRQRDRDARPPGSTSPYNRFRVRKEDERIDDHGQGPDYRPGLDPEKDRCDARDSARMARHARRQHRRPSQDEEPSRSRRIARGAEKSASADRCDECVALMPTLDTNVLVRFLVSDDVAQGAAAIELVRRATAAGESLFVPITRWLRRPASNPCELSTGRLPRCRGRIC